MAAWGIKFSHICSGQHVVCSSGRQVDSVLWQYCTYRESFSNIVLKLLRIWRQGFERKLTQFHLRCVFTNIIPFFLGSCVLFLYSLKMFIFIAHSACVFIQPAQNWAHYANIQTHVWGTGGVKDLIQISPSLLAFPSQTLWWHLRFPEKTSKLNIHTHT